jgi:hypothetical protein
MLNKLSVQGWVAEITAGHCTLALQATKILVLCMIDSNTMKTTPPTHKKEE